MALTSEVFEHIFNPDQLLNEIYRILRPGGALIMTLLFAFPEHEEPFDFARCTKFGIRAILERAGFSEVRVNKLGSMIHAIGQLIAAYLFYNTKHNKIVQAIAQIALIAPVTILTEIFAVILPRDNMMYCNLIIEVRKL